MSRHEQRLQARLERGLQRRLRSLQQRLQLDVQEDEASAESLSSDQVAAMQWEVADVRFTRTPLSSEQLTHAIPASMLTRSSTNGSSSSHATAASLSLSLASLHPSREFASAHLAPMLAAHVHESVLATRFWLESVESACVNFSVDESISRVELRQVSVCAADEEADAKEETDEARRVRFSLPLSLSLRIPGDITISCQRTADEQASQIAFHTAQAEAEASSSSGSAVSARSDSARAVHEHEHQRFIDVVTVTDERAGTAACAVSPSVLPVVARVLHAYGFPLNLTTAAFFHALSGFAFLQHWLVDTGSMQPAAPPALFEPEAQAQVLRRMEALLQPLLWPEDLSEPGQSQLLSSALIESPPPHALAEASSSPPEQKAQEAAVEASSASAADTEETKSHPADVPVESESEAESQEPSPLPLGSTLSGLVCSYLHPAEWALELAAMDAVAPPAARTVARSSKSAGKGKHGKGGKRR